MIPEQALETTKAQFPDGIKPYGADVLRFVLLRRDVQAKDVPVDLLALAEEGFRFGNKLANMVHFVDLVAEAAAQCPPGAGGRPEHSYLVSLQHWLRTFQDHWVRVRLRAALVVYQTSMEECRVHGAFEALFHFLLNDFCDVYLESTKTALWRKDPLRLAAVLGTLTECAELALRAWSAFMPVLSNFLLDRSTSLRNLDYLKVRVVVESKVCTFTYLAR